MGGFPRDLLALAPKLRWFQQWGAGADWLMKRPEVADKDFLLTNVSGIHAVPISEHIFAFLLAFARGFPKAMRDQLGTTWSQRERQPSFELAGKTMLLLGTGAIGARTARPCPSVRDAGGRGCAATPTNRSSISTRWFR